MLAQNRKENSRLSSGSFELNLTNNADLAYVGPIFLGTPLQGSNLTAYIYDTGSGYLTIPASSCLTCNLTFLYVKAASSTSQSYTAYTTTKLSYGSAQLYGSMTADTVCLSNYEDSQTCVTDFGFFLINK